MSIAVGKLIIENNFFLFDSFFKSPSPSNYVYDKTEMNQLQIKRSIALTSISVIVSLVAFINITRHSGIRAIEILVTLALGMGISALIFNIAHLYKARKTT